MNKQTEHSKIKKDEVVSDENAELNEDALKQVNGGTFELKKEDGTLKGDDDYKDWIDLLNGPQPTSRPGG